MCKCGLCFEEEIDRFDHFVEEQQWIFHTHGLDCRCGKDFRSESARCQHIIEANDFKNHGAQELRLVSRASATSQQLSQLSAAIIPTGEAPKQHGSNESSKQEEPEPTKSSSENLTSKKTPSLPAVKSLNPASAATVNQPGAVGLAVSRALATKTEKIKFTTSFASTQTDPIDTPKREAVTQTARSEAYATTWTQTDTQACLTAFAQTDHIEEPMHLAATDRQNT